MKRLIILLSIVILLLNGCETDPNTFCGRYEPYNIVTLLELGEPDHTLNLYLDGVMSIYTYKGNNTNVTNVGSWIQNEGGDGLKWVHLGTEKYITFFEEHGITFLRISDSQESDDILYYKVESFSNNTKVEVKKETITTKPKSDKKNSDWLNN